MCQNLLDHRKSQRVPEEHPFLLINYAKALDCVHRNELWKILQEMGIPDHLTCLLGYLYTGWKQQLELGMEQQTGSKSGKEQMI